MKDLTVIIPTLNEAKNIRGTINEVMKYLPAGGEVLVVDDNSSDATLYTLNDLVAIYNNLHYVVRFSDYGLSNSLVEGFKIATTPVIMVLDADGQHPPEKIPLLYQAILDGNDIAIASRYVEGGGVIHVSQFRRLLSWGATFLARFFFPKVTDTGSGFFAFRKEVIKDAPLEPQGFRMLFEILGKGKWEKVKEIPYVLQIRKEGQSKLKGSTVVSYLKQVWGLLLYSLMNKESSGHKEIFHLLSFALVGATGICMNVGSTYMLTEYTNLWYMWSACIGVELSILTNFWLNEVITFRDLKNKLYQPLQRFALYHAICIGGILIMILTLTIFVEVLHVWYIWGSLTGVIFTFLWNFSVNRGITWSE